MGLVGYMTSLKVSWLQFADDSTIPTAFRETVLVYSTCATIGHDKSECRRIYHWIFKGKWMFPGILVADHARQYSPYLSWCFIRLTTTSVLAKYAKRLHTVYLSVFQSVTWTHSRWRYKPNWKSVNTCKPFLAMPWYSRLFSLDGCPLSRHLIGICWYWVKALNTEGSNYSFRNWSKLNEAQSPIFFKAMCLAYYSHSVWRVGFAVRTDI